MAPLAVDAPGKVAVILGGNGITGTYLCEHLLKKPESDWKKIIAVSRKLPSRTWLRYDLGLTESQADDVASGKGRLVWITADLIEETVDQLRAKFERGGMAQGTHLFWAAYISIDGTGAPKERVANAQMFEQGVRAALEVSKETMRRVILQCGAKWYGPHRRSVPMPLKESMPMHLQGADFYVDQRDSLLRFQREFNHSFDWTITLPGTVCGFTRASYQSLGTALALYAAIKAYLKEPLEFPGTRQKFGTGDDLIDAGLLADFDIWCATTPKCGGEIFNIVNSDFFSWKSVWPVFVRSFGCVPPQRVGAGMDAGGRFSIERDVAPRAEQVWSEMCQKYRGLDPEAIKYATFGFADFALAGNQMMVLSMVKARKFGWMGVKDTEEMFEEIIGRMRKAGALPPAPASAAGRL